MGDGVAVKHQMRRWYHENGLQCIWQQAISMPYAVTFVYLVVGL